MTKAILALTLTAARTWSFSSYDMSRMFAMKSASRPASLTPFFMMNIVRRWASSGDSTDLASVRLRRDETLSTETSSCEWDLSDVKSS